MDRYRKIIDFFLHRDAAQENIASSDSISSICCVFVPQQVVLQIEPAEFGFQTSLASQFAKSFEKHRIRIGPIGKEYLSQIQFYSIFSELPVISNNVVIITVCVKVANSTGFLQIKRQSGLSYRGTIYACCFVS